MAAWYRERRHSQDSMTRVCGVASVIRREDRMPIAAVRAVQLVSDLERTWHFR